jgi:colanic acid/amylovoran biosynthesis glycosyltransferase
LRRVIMVMPNWNAPSLVPIHRQLTMLHEAGILAGIILPYQTGINNWLGVPVYSLESTNSLRHQISNAVLYKLGMRRPNLLTNFAKAVKSINADTIICQYGTLAVELHSVLQGLPHRIFIHVHGGDTEDFQDDIYWERLRELSQHCIILSNSEHVSDRLIKRGIAPERIILKYLGVEIPNEKSKHHYKVQDITVLHLGRLVDCKSPDRTIMAFDRACENGLQGQLIIAGDGPLLVTCQLFRARSRFSDRIHLLGAVSKEQATKLFSDADIFTLHAITGEITGQSEAFGVSIVEAMAASLPVVTCPVGGIVEIVIPGHTGILTTPGSIAEHADALLTLANDPNLRNVMGNAGRQRVYEKFSVENEKQMLLQILN